VWAGGAENGGTEQVRDGIHGQAVVNRVKTPLDKSCQVEGTLEKATGKTADQVKDATP
jgi:hypothetical protein